MALEIVRMTLGLVQTNCYLAADSEAKLAVVIDPADDGDKIAAEAQARGWQIVGVWLTHAHFDHIAGGGGLAAALPEPVPVAMHPGEQPLWDVQGGAQLFGIDGIDPGPDPSVALAAGQKLTVGRYEFEVLFAPGHTPGHVMFYCASENVLFSGDVIFQGSIGRTDLPGGSYQTLMESIRTQVLTLPDETQILNGHGPETTVGRERVYNPFLHQ